MKKLLMLVFIALVLFAFVGSASAVVLYENDFNNEDMDPNVTATLTGGILENVNNTVVTETFMIENYLLLTQADDMMELTLSGVKIIQTVQFSYESFGTWDDSSSSNPSFVDVFFATVDDQTGNLLDLSFDIKGAGVGANAADNTFEIKKNTSGDVVLTWDIDVTGSDEMLGIDNIVVTGSAVPEPASLLLVATGLLGLAGISRRRINS